MYGRALKKVVDTHYKDYATYGHDFGGIRIRICRVTEGGNTRVVDTVMLRHGWYRRPLTGKYVTPTYEFTGFCLNAVNWDTTLHLSYLTNTYGIDVDVCVSD